MKYLKLKDGVDLFELEKLGFERGIVNTMYISDKGVYIDIADSDRILKITYVGLISDINNKDKVIKSSQNDFLIELKLPSIIMTLIKLDLIEII